MGIFAKVFCIFYIIRRVLGLLWRGGCIFDSVELSVAADLK